ncbi:MarR family winged helix-turn-helix transcriptional regulator [Kerstersia gyiorum]|jgi:DNA-binding MarR family transcriptional regulator|uniref:MarR family transcriptional regulator n=1 Tax=Kerstersia gyiorum TaxID=206506 RepID=A0A171KP12_9BURK|nr:MarR family winged helix-turn-helix transcriptional regulator [Kerstersia gyiorum]AZV92725.1 MarR family transcriptional regulator [Bordetella sp. J329]MCO7637927.1 MarR family winged helix-turn-helix transcriptional regulator [Pseudomonas sp. S 311-6]KAB0542274.1 winged helix-turn-helix transcriptional regulator [Kerstersia gyiorum]KKO70629.1 MarR family transcriptional regulator [Kerstersia gyiorum]MCH4270977.1 MarR family winged helix-turn-helix transcriptional regulator [Kerstersia gyio
MTINKRVSRFNPVSEEFVKEDFPFYWVARLNNLYVQRMEKALRKVGADVPTWRVLFILKENGTSSMSEIALHAVAKLSTITKIVYRMKADGLVDTMTSAQDGRVTIVALTERGQQMITEMRDATAQVFAQGFSGLSSVKIARLNQMLEQMFNNLHDA